MTTQRFAVVTTSYPARPGDAAGHFVHTQVRDLVAGGAAVTVIAPHADGAVDDERWHVVRVRHGDALGWPGALSRLRERPSRAWGLARFVAGAARELSALPVDRVVAHFLVPCGAPIALASPRGAALDVVVHGSDARLVARLPRAARRALFSSLLARRATFRCVSHDLERKLHALDPRLAQRTRVEPCAIDVSGAPSRPAARSTLGVDGPLIVVAGRLVAGKRVDAALSAASSCAARLVVVGDGPERAALQRSFPAAHFVGQVPRDVALTWIAAADVVVSASRNEGAPSVVREARALGVRVVTARCGDVERWAQADAGIVVTGDREASAAIATALGTAPTRQRSLAV